MPGSEPTHGDILEKLGELKGQVATLISMTEQRREDINAIYGRVGVLEKTTASRDELGSAEHRITGLEKEVAKWAGICLAVAFLMPIAMPRIQQGLGVIEADAMQRDEKAK
jgi:hypothetical protein